MNELIFIFHAFFVTGCTLGALYLGKEALISLVVLLAILSNLFVTKQIMLFGLQATPTDALTIGLVLSLNLLQEYYGKNITKKAIGISFILSLAYTAFSQLHLMYIPSMHDTMHSPARSLLCMMPRIVCASLFTYFIVQRIDCYFYELFKNKLAHKYLIMRNYGSLILSQLLDTILFSFLGLYGTLDSIIPVIAISYSIKLIIIAFTTPFLLLSKRISRVKTNESVSI